MTPGSFPLVSLIGDGLCLHGSRLSTMLHRLQRMRAAFLLVLHAGNCGLMLQSPPGWLGGYYTLE
jgi:hypothetical protein